MKLFLKKILIQFGSVLWYFYPKKIKNIDILFIFPTYQLGGADHVHAQIVNAASIKYNTITLFFANSKNTFYLPLFEHVSKVVDLSFFTYRVPGQWILTGYLLELLKHEKSNKVVFSYNSMIAVDLAQQLKKDTIHFIDIIHAINGYTEQATIPSIPFLKKRVVIDQYTKSVLENMYKINNLNQYKKNLLLIGNGISIPNKHKIKKDRLEVLYVGRESPEKRIHIIEEIANKLSDFDKDVHFTLVGIDRANQNKKNITYVPPQKDPKEFYLKSNILLLTSAREGFPLVLMEAMSYGLVPVCTDVGGIHTHIENKQNGFLIKKECEEEIINTTIKILLKLKEDKSLLAIMSDRGYEYAKKHFDIKSFEKKYLNLFAYYLEYSQGI